jgi:WD40 repeat protein
MKNSIFLFLAASMLIMGHGQNFKLYRTIIKTDPPALIYVDGKRFGMSPITLWLHAGKRQIEARRVGYETTQKWVMVESDKPNQIVTFKLPIILKIGYQIPDNCSFEDLSLDNRWISYNCVSKYQQRGQELFVSNIQSNQSVSLDPQPTAVGSVWGLFSPDSEWFLLQYAYGPFYIYKVGDWNHAHLLYYKNHFLGASEVWSPDGKMLAVVNLKPGLAAISLLTLDSKDITVLKKCLDSTLACEPCNFCGPYWSSDSQFVMYKDYSTNDPQRWQWWTYEIATGKRRALVDFEKSGDYPSWSPDGSKIRIYDLNTDAIKEIATIEPKDYPYPLRRLLFSPNNQYVAVITAANETYIIPLDKNKQIKVLETMGQITRWSGDSKNLLGESYDTFTLISYTNIWEVK